MGEEADGTEDFSCLFSKEGRKEVILKSAHMCLDSGFGVGSKYLLAEQKDNLLSSIEDIR